uniref:Uncharacterized protein LOC100186104 n=1 Tax=Phallusia mammillata TaxID=59560 RepID=A0A6F9DJ52_9ASCI|nr:uncharacterized protein LOC100186104 [Phallusia mammillata]
MMNTERKWIVGCAAVQLLTTLLLFIYLKDAYPGVNMTTPSEMINKYKPDTSLQSLFRISWAYLFVGKFLTLYYLYGLAKKRTIFSTKLYIIWILTMVNMVLWMLAYGFEAFNHALLTMVVMAGLCFVHVYEVTKRYVDSEMNYKTSSDPLPETSTWMFRHLVVYPNVFSAWWGIESIAFSLVYFLAPLSEQSIGEKTISGTSSLVFFGICQILWVMADFSYFKKYTRHIWCVYVFMVYIAGGILAINYESSIGFTTNNYVCVGECLFALSALFFRYQSNQSLLHRPEAKLK